MAKSVQSTSKFRLCRQKSNRAGSLFSRGKQVLAWLSASFNKAMYDNMMRVDLHQERALALSISFQVGLGQRSHIHHPQLLRPVPNQGAERDARVLALGLKRARDSSFTTRASFTAQENFMRLRSAVDRLSALHQIPLPFFIAQLATHLVDVASFVIVPVIAT